MRDEEQQLLELFNLEMAKIRVLRNAQKVEEEERQEKPRTAEQQKALEITTKQMNMIIARASKEDQEEEAQVKYKVFITLYYVMSTLP